MLVRGGKITFLSCKPSTQTVKHCKADVIKKGPVTAQYIAYVMINSPGIG